MGWIPFLTYLTPELSWTRVDAIRVRTAIMLSRDTEVIRVATVKCIAKEALLAVTTSEAALFK